jgi:hypothetical protein
MNDALAARGLVVGLLSSLLRSICQRRFVLF